MMEMNHVEVMLRLHAINKTLKKIMKRYSEDEPVGHIKSRNLQYGILSIHAIGHWAHDLSIDLAKQAEGFSADNYLKKEQLTKAAHMNGDDHNSLWYPENIKEYDKEEKGN